MSFVILVRNLWLWGATVVADHLFWSPPTYGSPHDWNNRCYIDQNLWILWQNKQRFPYLMVASCCLESSKPQVLWSKMQWQCRGQVLWKAGVIGLGDQRQCYEEKFPFIWRSCTFNCWWSHQLSSQNGAVQCAVDTCEFSNLFIFTSFFFLYGFPFINFLLFFLFFFFAPRLFLARNPVAQIYRISSINCRFTHFYFSTQD